MAISLVDALQILDSQGKNALWEAVYRIANQESKFANRIYKHLFWLKREKKQQAEEIGNDTIEKVVNLIVKLREDFMYEKMYSAEFIQWQMQTGTTYFMYLEDEKILRKLKMAIQMILTRRIYILLTKSF